MVAGSERRLPLEGSEIGAVDGTARVRVSVVVRPRTPLPDVLSGVPHRITRETYARTYGASQNDIAKVEAFAREAGLDVVATHVARRTLEIEGTVDALGRAFGTTLSLYTDPTGRRFRGRTGALSVPASISGIVHGVFGLDDRTQARTHFRRASDASNASKGLSPVAVATAYGFPPGDGAGQTIALIELGGGFTQSDLDAYFADLQLAPPSVTAVSVDGATNAPTGSADGPDAEVALDIEVAGAITPGAKIVVYFAPNTDQGFLDAITTAVHDTKNAPDVVSISWGGPESTWTAQAMTNMDDAIAAAALLGVTVTVAAGDSGSSDGVEGKTAHVDFPASSPHALGCGGTHLVISKTKLESETVWNDGTSGGATGGGVSDVFDLPAYQHGAGVPPSVNSGARVGRGVPDIGGNADPKSGYLTMVDGFTGAIGGTSAVAPLCAALVARINAKLAKPIGFINPQLYASPGALRDITSGNNGAYKAKEGWDACTGLGSPNGAALVAVFAKSATSGAGVESTSV